MCVLVCWHCLSLSLSYHCCPSQPWVDHVPVSADYSDLQERVQWCRDNDGKCQEIVRNAKRFYDAFLSREALLDYMALTLSHVSACFVREPCMHDPPPFVEAEAAAEETAEASGGVDPAEMAAYGLPCTFGTRKRPRG